MVWLGSLRHSALIDGALDANGDVLVSDTGSLAIIRIDSLTGSQTVLANGGSLGVPFGIAVERKGDIK